MQKLMAAVGKLGDGVKDKPLGVFLDNAGTTIFLVAFGISLVGIATIYEIKTGTPITTNAVLSLLDKTQVKVKGFAGRTGPVPHRLRQEPSRTADLRHEDGSRSR